ncbi:hypothetical protein HPB50_021344 [Hyalomma asiaticum]|uniref:Uncharacterized protein n=1 Tax=Hyalomma asiaticum TaxID=266040 RepID=A0ACB7T792_HYAAI|nr:hypothetical protein HPB50_021344 [Hyalomma asiaticum]
MDFARSVFGGNSTEGYSRKNTEVETLSEDEEDVRCGGSDCGAGDSISANLFGGGSAQGYSPAPGGPFSALTPSMWPQDLLASLAQPEDTGCHHDCRFDEFGFRIEDEDGPEQTSRGVDSEEPFQENPQHRLQWIAYLEFTHNNEVGDLTWDKVEPHLPHTPKLQGLLHEGGIPHSLRPQLWMHLSGAARKKRQAGLTYREVVRASANDHLLTSKQIEKDLLRTMPSNACFSHATSTGIPRLRRVLRGLAWLYPDIGYCQGTSMIAASLLLFLEEEDAFWMLCTIVEDLLPASYYSSTLAGVQADQRVLRALVTACLPDLDALLKEHDIELSLITLHWFLTLFASVVPMRVLLRIWDLLFYDGSIVLFQVLLGMLSSKESELRSLENSAQIFNALSDLPGSVRDAEQLLEASRQASRDVTEAAIEALATQAPCLPDGRPGGTAQPRACTKPAKTVVPRYLLQHLTRRQVKRSKSVLQLLLQGEAGDCTHPSEEDVRHKNVRQTEILVDLREAILQVARHFQALDPKLQVTLNSDYSMESHARDHENFANVSRSRHRRAKALLNFERHDDDELGFRKNDIITIISQKDEHCWIGELNGLRGWFPAKFVELLDERSKQVANKEVEKDFNSVYSRLVLCKTYSSERCASMTLFQSVQAVNMSHDQAHAQMDVKLRSLVCIGLNSEQVLHLWFEVLCSCLSVVHKWYQPWSFINSPGWVQIKCELRLLSQFAFNLNPNWELPTQREPSQPLREGVRDMLVKHHLFSWDL